MLKRLSWRLLGAALLLSGCSDRSDRPDLPSAFPSTPLRALDGVHLGMTAGELRSVRPSAEFSPYSGFRELVDSASIGYRFSSVGETGIDDDRELEVVMLSRSAASIAEARSQWNEAVAAATAQHGMPSTCEQIAGSSPGVQAVWRIGEEQLVIGARERFSTGNESVPDRLTYTVSIVDERPARQDVSEIPCPESAK